MNLFSFKYRNLILGITATAVGYCMVITPHTIFLDKYRWVTARYQIGKEVPLGPKMEQRIQQVMNDLKLQDDIRNIIKPYSVFGFDVSHAGTLNTRYGAILGIPANYVNTLEYLRENLQIMEKSIEWTQDANNFLNTLILCENAQKFAIASRILQIQAEEPYYNSISLAVIIATLYIFYNAITYKFKLRQHNVICRTLYSVFSLFGIMSWVGIKDYRSYCLDSEHDKALCNLGPEYIKGGQEYYEKMLDGNKILRRLPETQAEKTFTIGGNTKVFWRQKHVPISHRKEFFDSHLRDLN